MFKQYLSRAQTRAWSFELPIGDPTGGAAYGEKNDPVTAGLAIAGGSIVGGLISSQGAQSAADTAAGASTQASQASIAEQRRQFDINQANQQPWLTAGTGAVNQLAAGLAPGGQFTQNFTPADFLAGQDPGYAFRMSEGMKALNASMAAKGLGVSGAGIKGAINYGQGAASQEYQNAFNRYQTNRANVLNPLQSLAGVGQSTATALGTAGSNMASNVGNTLMSNAGNVGNAAMASAGLQSSAYGGAANMLGRLYGSYGLNPTSTAPSTDPYSSNWISNYPGYTG